MRLLSRAAGWFSTPGPTVALEVAADCVSGVMVTGSRQTARVVGHARVGLPADSVVPAVSTSNVIGVEAARTAVRTVLERLPGRSVRVGLVIPDSAAKVSLVRFDSVPKREADLDPMIRWQVRKTVPFALDDAQVSYSEGIHLDGGGREYVVAVVRRDIVQEYEGLCTDCGVQPGIVDLATFSLINAGLTRRQVDDAGDWLLVHAAAGYHSIGIVKGAELVFFRNRTGEGDLSDLVHQTAMYYEDRLGGDGIAKVFLAGQGDEEAVDSVTRSIAARMGAPVEIVAPSLAVGGGGDQGVLTALAAPLGLLLREQLVAA